MSSWLTRKHSKLRYFMVAEERRNVFGFLVRHALRLGFCILMHPI